MVATSLIRKGTEIYVNYGVDWFEDRGISEVVALPAATHTTPKVQHSNAQCLSHLYIKPSEIPMAGKGVFSRVSYAEGAVVYVSPVLVLSKHHVQKYQDTNVLINYVISEEGSDAAILPIGLTGMLNHGGVKSNVRMEWYTHEGEVSRLGMSISDLEAQPFAPLDISYVATRPISEGEELLLDYGEAWSTQWIQHLNRLLEWNGDLEWTAENKENLEEPSVAFKPQFRAAIGAPKGLFPSHFQSDCIGNEVVCASYLPPGKILHQAQLLYAKSKAATRSIMAEQL